ncbi:MAG TPA: ABC transporter permease [Caulobacteraceae bacterium]|jgi:phospholipid/cholesterol/gamma-HCH transport system permease protein
MEQAADFTIEPTEGGPLAVLSGDWTATQLQGTELRLEQALIAGEVGAVDARAIRRCDTSGAYAIWDAARGARLPRGRIVCRPDTNKLIDLVEEASTREPTLRRRPRSPWEVLDRLGRGVVNIGLDVYETTAFNGRLVATTARAVVNPRRLRMASLFSLMDRAGLDALPIVATTSFFIGAVVGLIGANMLSDFGAQVFAVELIGIAVLREFGILITAVLLAGRSASSFAAEIGSMKMNEEVDAMRVMGVDPFEALVLPRFIALLLTVPLLVFVANLAGLAGGLVVVWSALDISPAFFIQRLHDNVPIQHFWVGMSKAPVLAIVVAAIGCRQGMEVGGDVDSLGRRVTAAVVHAIFAIILIDAVFALIYMELNV